MLDTARAHPYITGGVIILGVIVVFSLSGGSSDSVESDGAVSYVTDQTAVAAGLQLQQIQAQANAVTQQTNAALEAERIKGANELSIATLAAQVQSQTINAEQQTALMQLQAQTSVAQSTLQAQLEAGRQQQQVALAQIAASTDQARINADTTTTLIKATTKKSFWGKIFG